MLGCIPLVAIGSYWLGNDAMQTLDGLKGAKTLNQLEIWHSDVLSD